LNPLHPLKTWRRNAANAAKLYGAIVAQARLPVFYQDLAVPDTLEGRFLVLSLHLFAVLHRLKAEGGAAVGLAQDLTDRFSEDMETVLREIGVGDLAIPKKVRGLASASAGLLQAYGEALGGGRGPYCCDREGLPCAGRRAGRCNAPPGALSNAHGACA
jgi:cytochrome b pre-mRNA-processing protein 3